MLTIELVAAVQATSRFRFVDTPYQDKMHGINKF
jgi:hypothetical protein